MPNMVLACLQGSPELACLFKASHKFLEANHAKARQRMNGVGNKSLRLVNVEDPNVELRSLVQLHYACTQASEQVSAIAVEIALFASRDDVRARTSSSVCIVTRLRVGVARGRGTYQRGFGERLESKLLRGQKHRLCPSPFWLEASLTVNDMSKAVREVVIRAGLDDDAQKAAGKLASGQLKRKQGINKPRV